MTCSLHIVGIVDSLTLQVPNEKALSLARLCWGAGGAIQITLTRGDLEWTWMGDKQRFLSAVVAMAGGAR